MKKIIWFASIIALFLPGFAATSAAGQTGGQSAMGSYEFSFEDGHTKHVEFDARTLAGGGATGQLFFSDETEVTYLDVDGAGDPQRSYRGFFLKASFDGLVVFANHAVASGTVSDSSIASLIGQRVLLTIEDNGDNGKEADRLTWGVYKSAERSWTPSDAELARDEGVGMRWLATDAERTDDGRVEMPMDASIDTETFPLAAYTFDDLAHWRGDIRVQP